MIEPAFSIKTIQSDENFGKFVIEPLEEGYGHTVGNSMRRVLLTSIKGAAITSVRIDGVKHQFSQVTGIKEDIVEILLNLKQIRLKIESDKEVRISLTKKGAGVAVAGDMEVPAGVTVVNPDHYIATLSDKKAKLEIEMTARTGYGYKKAEEQKSDTLGVLSLDSVFSPIRRVNYKVESTRVGRMTNLDKLILEVWTDGSVLPSQAIEESAKILVSYFLQIYQPKAEIEEGVAVTPTVSDEVLKMRIEELDIPTRIINALIDGGIETVGQLLGTPKIELVKLKNLGSKSLSTIEEKLREKGVALNV